MDHEVEATRGLVRALLGAAREVHRVLGPGLLESVYADCLGLELTWRAVRFARQVSIPIVYKGSHLGIHHRIDFLVDGRVPLRILAVELLLPIHQAQLRTALRLARLPLGLLLNFNVPVLQIGIRQVVNHAHLGSPVQPLTLCPHPVDILSPTHRHCGTFGPRNAVIDPRTWPGSCPTTRPHAGSTLCALRLARRRNPPGT